MLLFFDSTEEGALPPPTTTQRVQARVAAAQRRLSPPSSRRGTPKLFCRFFSVFLGPVVFSSFSLGGWGSPCRVFLFPRCFGGIFLPLGGWVPLAAFSRRFPLASWGVGGCFVFFVFSCHFLHLASSLF